jgi:hypothetical protein
MWFRNFTISGLPGDLNPALNSDFERIISIFIWDNVNTLSIELFKNTLNEALMANNLLVYEDGHEETIDSVLVHVDYVESVINIILICKHNEVEKEIEEYGMYGNCNNCSHNKNSCNQDNVPVVIDFFMERMKDLKEILGRKVDNFMDYLSFGHGLEYPDGDVSSWAEVRKFLWASFILGLTKTVIFAFVLLVVFSIGFIIYSFPLTSLFLCFLSMTTYAGLPD